MSEIYEDFVDVAQVQKRKTEISYSVFVKKERSLEVFVLYNFLKMSEISDDFVEVAQV